MFETIIDWLDERIRIRALWKGFEELSIPGGSSWFYVLGSSLLFFAVFAVMLYIATERPAFLLAGAGMFVTGAAIGYAQEMTALGLDPRPETHLAALLAVRPADVRRVGTRLALEASFFLTGGAP